MTLEKQLRGAWDRARQILTHIEAARDHHAAGINEDHLVGFETGCAMGELHLLEQGLIELVQEHFYDGDKDES